MNFIQKISKALNNGAGWYNVLSFMKKNEFDRAYTRLSSMHRIGVFKVYIDLMSALALRRQKKFQECIDQCETILEYILQAEGFNDAEKLYCQAYANWMLENCADRLSLTIPAETVKPGSIAEIDLERVRKLLRENFPLRVHPNWKEG